MVWRNTDKPLAVGDKVLTSIGEATVEWIDDDKQNCRVKMPQGEGHFPVAKVSELPRWRP